MITLAQCSGFAGLAPNEIVLGAARSETHRVLLSGYLLSVARSESCAQNDRRRYSLFAGCRSVEARGGFADRAAAVPFRLSRSQTGSASVFPYLQ
jgi:putative hemolysin